MNDRPTPSRGIYAWYVVGALFIAYAFSYADRTILTLLVAPIRATFHITDFQLSLLHGAAFGILYSLLGIPIARLADRYSRIRLIAAGIFLWSGMTVIGGLARNVTQIFVSRVGVGIGEATLSPAAYSIIADLFPPRRLTRALSLYTAAPCVGAGLALIVAGQLISVTHAHDLPVLGHLASWQVVFIYLGLPGLLVALLMATIREPTRTGLAVTMQAGLKMPLRQVGHAIYERRTVYGLLALGYSALSLAWNGVSSWVPTFLMRTYHASPAEVGWQLGVLLLVFGTLGPICGALCAEKFHARGVQEANVFVGLVASALMALSGVFAPLMPTQFAALAVYGIFVWGATLPFGAAAAAIQEITPNQMRALVAALHFLCMNLAGIGLGPMVVALFTDGVFHNDLDLRYSMVITASVFGSVAALSFWRAREPYRRSLSTTRLDEVISPGYGLSSDHSLPPLESATCR